MSEILIFIVTIIFVIFLGGGLIGLSIITILETTSIRFNNIEDRLYDIEDIFDCKICNKKTCKIYPKLEMDDSE